MRERVLRCLDLLFAACLQDEELLPNITRGPLNIVQLPTEIILRGRIE